MSKNHRQQLLYHLRQFADSVGDDFTAFNDDDVNDWIDDLTEESALAPKTLRAYRSSVLNGWRTAYRAKLVGIPPGDIRSIRAYKTPPVAWNAEELRKLIAATTSDHEGPWFRAYILLIWCTALRRDDAYKVDTRQLGPGRTWYLSQQKTGEAHTVRLSTEAVDALNEVGGRLPDKSRGVVAAGFRRLRAAAGVRLGTARWIRRSAASYVERERPGQGAKLLGHRTPGMAERHYFDPSIIGSTVAGPSLDLAG